MCPRFPGSQEETMGVHWAPLSREGSLLQPPQPRCPQKESTDLVVQGAPPVLLCLLLGHVSPRKSLADETLTVSMYDGATPLDDLMRKSFRLRGRPPAVRLGLTWCFEGILSFSWWSIPAPSSHLSTSFLKLGITGRQRRTVVRSPREGRSKPPATGPAQLLARLKCIQMVLPDKTNSDAFMSTANTQGSERKFCDSCSVIIALNSYKPKDGCALDQETKHKAEFCFKMQREMPWGLQVLCNRLSWENW